MSSMNLADDRPPPAGGDARPASRAISWEQVADLFAAALEIPISERKQWLSGLSGVDEALRQEVASLLEASENARDFLIPGEIEGG